MTAERKKIVGPKDGDTKSWTVDLRRPLPLSAKVLEVGAALKSANSKIGAFKAGNAKK